MKVVLCFGEGRNERQLKEIDVDILTTYYHYLEGKHKLYYDGLSRGEKKSLISLLTLNSKSPINNKLHLFIITNSTKNLSQLSKLTNTILWREKRKEEGWLTSSSPSQILDHLLKLKLPPNLLLSILSHSNTKRSIVEWLARIDRYVGKIHTSISYTLFTFIPSAIMVKEKRSKVDESVFTYFREKYGYSSRDVKLLMRFRELVLREIECI